VIPHVAARAGRGAHGQPTIAVGFDAQLGHVLLEVAPPVGIPVSAAWIWVLEPAEWWALVADVARHPLAAQVFGG
jgi:hypothetical protein